MFTAKGLVLPILVLAAQIVFTPNVAIAGDEDVEIEANKARFHACCKNITDFPAELLSVACDYEQLSHMFLNVSQSTEETLDVPLVTNHSALANDGKMRNAYFQCLTNGRDESDCCKRLLHQSYGIRENCLPWCNGSVTDFHWAGCNGTSRADAESLLGVVTCHFVS